MEWQMTSPRMNESKIAELIDLFEGSDAERWQQVRDLFIPDGIRLTTGLRDALAAGNLNQAARQAHGLKGISAEIGAEGLQGLAYQVEIAAKENRAADAQSGAKTLYQEYAVVTQYLQDKAAGG
jgi:HPt (histidine-containing phosphotransfer) domain-containing protein